MQKKNGYFLNFLPMLKRKKPLSREAAQLRMASLCAASEQCTFDIRKKLLKMVERQDVEPIIEFLIENKFIDDARFAGSFARDKMKFSGWGTRKIRLGLMARQIPSDIISQAIDSLDKKEYARTCLSCARNKAKSIDIEDYDDRQKLFRFLISRGFESSLISKVTAHLKAEKEQ